MISVALDDVFAIIVQGKTAQRPSGSIECDRVTTIQTGLVDLYLFPFSERILLLLIAKELQFYILFLIAFQQIMIK